MNACAVLLYAYELVWSTPQNSLRQNTQPQSRSQNHSVISSLSRIQCTPPKPLKHNSRQKQKSAKKASVFIPRSLPSDIDPSRFTPTRCEFSSGKRASSWLTAIPVEEFGFALYKGAFRDAQALRYGWSPNRAPI